MQKIAFATGLRHDEGPAVFTAAALASATGAKLFTVHASTGGPVGEIPRPEDAARRWGASIEGEVMLHTCCEDPADTLLDALRRITPELVIVGTHGRSGISQILTESVAESVARNISVPTLFVPLHGKGLASASSGVIDLRRILVPAGDAVATRVGLDAAAWLARAVGAKMIEVVLVHVDDGHAVPEMGDVPAGLSVVRKTAKGSLDESIAELSVGFDACAIVMATRGHDGILDSIAGSHTEHVVRKVSCPLLSVPIPA